MTPDTTVFYGTLLVGAFFAMTLGLSLMTADPFDPREDDGARLLVFGMFMVTVAAAVTAMSWVVGLPVAIVIMLLALLRRVLFP